MYTSAIEMIFDGVSMSEYGLYLMDSNSGSNDLDFGANYKIIEDNFNGISYTFGMVDNGNLSFEMCLMSREVLSAYDISTISRILFNHKVYKKLQVIEDSYIDKYVMCKLNSAKKVMIGNECYGFRFEVQCDSSYWYENEVVQSVITSTVINNTCDTNDVVPLRVKIVAKVNTDVAIKNLDSNKETKITKMLQGETITLNSKLETIKSDKVSYTYDRFNLEWVELHPGYNHFQVTGNVEVEFIYQLKRRG